MKKTILSLLFSCSLALTLSAQTPTPTPQNSSPPAPAASVSNTVTVRDADDDDDEDAIERAVKKSVRKSFDFSVGRHHRGSDSSDSGDSDFLAIPIVGIIFSTIFGTPVLIVAAILFFSFLRSRSLHRTVRLMVEKGQPVPPALFASPPVIRARSDMRRGVVLSMIGIGLMLFFAAVNDWEGGAWAIGLIPFLIGAGYLLVWKLEGGKNLPAPPPLP